MPTTERDERASPPGSLRQRLREDSEQLNALIMLALNQSCPGIAIPWRIYAGNEAHGIAFGHFCLGVDSPLSRSDSGWLLPGMDLLSDQVYQLMQVWTEFLKQPINQVKLCALHGRGHSPLICRMRTGTLIPVLLATAGTRSLLWLDTQKGSMVQ